MSDPFRLAVVKALVAGIAEQVTPANGCTNDLTDASLYGRATYGDNDPLPMSNVIEDPREQGTTEATIPGKGHVVPWKLLLQGFVDDDEVEPTGPAYLLAAELMRAVAQLSVAGEGVLSRERKTNRVQSIRIGAPIVRPPDEFSAKAYCLIPLTLDLFETPSAPFT